METSLPPQPPQLPKVPFKSHHSGMETPFPSLRFSGQARFKSHHSGMETGASSCKWVRGQGPLNRTIVGWKRLFILTSFHPFTPSFKSHHSGMETEAAKIGYRITRVTLNRTIVGWKPHPAYPA